jgi:hypothetical protein
LIRREMVMRKNEYGEGSERLERKASTRCLPFSFGVGPFYVFMLLYASV